MKRIGSLVFMGIFMLLTLSACSNIAPSFSQATSEQNNTQEENSMQEYTDMLEHQQDANAFTIKISVNGTELTAVLENNVTTRALVEQMPMTLSMRDLYDREICYNYGTGAFPTETLRNDSYEVGALSTGRQQAALSFCIGKTENNSAGSIWVILNPGWRYLKQPEIQM